MESESHFLVLRKRLPWRENPKHGGTLMMKFDSYRDRRRSLLVSQDSVSTKYEVILRSESACYVWDISGVETNNRYFGE